MGQYVGIMFFFCILIVNSLCLLHHLFCSFLILITFSFPILDFTVHGPILAGGIFFIFEAAFMSAIHCYTNNEK